MDYIVSSKNSLDFRYFRDNSDLKFQTGNVAPYAPNDQSLQVGNWVLHDTHTFSPSLLNELRLGVDRDNSLVGVTDHDQLSNFGAIFPGVITPQMPNITVSGYYSLGTTDIFREHENIYQIGDNLRWFRGKHSISFGGEWERTEELNRGSSGNEGSFTFSGFASGNAWGDYLLGKPVTMTQASPYERLVKGWDWYAFAQDDIRVTPRLTVNLGLRYQDVRSRITPCTAARTPIARGSRARCSRTRRSVWSFPATLESSRAWFPPTKTISLLASVLPGTRLGKAG